MCGEAVEYLFSSECTEFGDPWGILVERSSWIRKCEAQAQSLARPCGVRGYLNGWSLKTLYVCRWVTPAAAAATVKA